MDPAQVSELFQDAVQIASNNIIFSLNPGEVDEPQAPNQNAIKGWKWKEIEDGLIQFMFANRNVAMNVLARRPWFFVDRSCIPPFYWNLSNLKELASGASPVYELPQGIEDAVGMSNLKFQATIDLNKPVFSGFFLRRQRLKDLWIQYKYERLPKMCFKCGLLTHDQSICFKPPTDVKDDKGNFYPMYGIWLKTDAKEKSTFTTRLAKWLQDWVFQKRLFLDPTL
ncbi:hypothetical protein G4B88_009422 [Cannabis sativa]|uniref:Zinc knuckle CX2CX4HX4C domain-containing protein n=1 Tax=Cannabis sativa TaxID=3483 RepID=A0A7J6GH06_CANSA|nr:hypothetical protein G4B88_009422 [Cannabis sativa]